MNRYTRAAQWGYRNPRLSVYSDAPDWMRRSNAAWAAAEIGAYFARRDMPEPELVEYLGGKAKPRFAIGNERLAVATEYPGIRIHHMTIC
jgi:hypothetical protein